MAAIRPLLAWKPMDRRQLDRDHGALHRSAHGQMKIPLDQSVVPLRTPLFRGERRLR